FLFNRALDVQDYGHLAISASSEKECKFWIEYKVGKPENPTTVFQSKPYPLPGNPQVHNLRIPMKHDGKIDQIALTFYEKPASSSINITSLFLTE
ncbi:MAG TPA: hypothetical protein VFC02_23655, partial [Anaerolineales bacterium]|nr:hypothetical protein [Anaerolineales bacterium]